MSKCAELLSTPVQKHSSATSVKHELQSVSSPKMKLCTRRVTSSTFVNQCGIDQNAWEAVTLLIKTVIKINTRYTQIAALSISQVLWGILKPHMLFLCLNQQADTTMASERCERAYRLDYVPLTPFPLFQKPMNATLSWQFLSYLRCSRLPHVLHVHCLPSAGEFVQCYQ